MVMRATDILAQNYTGAELIADGYRILAPGELDRDSLEAAAKVADDKAAGYEEETERVLWDCSAPIAVRLRGTASAIRLLADNGGAG